MQLTLWLDVSWDIDNGWFAFLGSDPKDDLVIADNDASDTGLDIMLKGYKTLIITFYSKCLTCMNYFCVKDNLMQWEDVFLFLLQGRG